MNDVEYFTFMLPPSIWSKKPYPSRFKMDLEYAAKAYPGATPILSTREVRSPMSSITADAPYQGTKRLKTPQEEAYRSWLISRIGAPSERIDDFPDVPF